MTASPGRPVESPVAARGRPLFVENRRGEGGLVLPPVCRRPLKLAAAVAVSIAAGLGCAPPERPHGVIVISIDTLRADHTTPYGASGGATPTLARLAAEGTVFERTYAQANETLFSHASLFTSQLPSDLGPVDYDLTIPDGTPTLASALSSAGWKTGGVVAGGHLARVFGLDDGFDTYTEGRRWGSFQETAPMAGRWLADVAEGDDPFMLFLHSYDCHAPYTKPHVFGRMATPGHSGPMLDRVHDSLTYEKIHNDTLYPDLPLGQLENSNGARILTPQVHAELAAYSRQKDVSRVTLGADDQAFLKGLYASSVLYADLWLQVVLDQIDDLGLTETTTIIVVSDHGEGLLDHGYFNHRDSLHDSATQVPFIVWRPDAEARGVRQREVTQLLDVAPTVLGLAGVDVPETMQGTDLSGCLDGGRCGTPGTAYSEAVLEMVSVTDGTFRLTVTGAPATSDALDRRIEAPAPAFADLYDAGGPPGSETSLSLLELDAAILARLIKGATAARAAGDTP